MDKEKQQPNESFKNTTLHYIIMLFLEQSSKKRYWCEIKMDSRGQINIVAVVVVAIAGVIGVIIFSSIYASLNKDQVDANAVSVLNNITILLAAIIVLGMLAYLALSTRGM